MQHTATLNRRPLSSFPGLFSSLPVPPVSQLAGTYLGHFVGPSWVRALAGPALLLGGLPGWWGKAFDGEGEGTNLLQRGGTIEQAVPIRLETRPSLIDGRKGLTVVYPRASPWPLAWIVDELRLLDDDSLLGMTMVTQAGLHRFPFPFLLELGAKDWRLPDIDQSPISNLPPPDHEQP